jgi:hypothetical protein
MTVQTLITALLNMPMDAEVRAYDADGEAVVPVTGLLYDGSVVELQTDEV